MVCPGVVRKAAKLVPTVLQALAFVVCIHVVGQVVFWLWVLFTCSTSYNFVSIGVAVFAGNVSSVWSGQVQVQQELSGYRTWLWI